MPIYEYQCQSCGHEMEALQKMNDPALSECPECNQPELKKLISAGGFQVKASSGFESGFKCAANEPLSPACGTGACPACE